MRRTRKEKNKITCILINHLNENIKEYLVVLSIFTIGIIIGTTVINITKESTQTEIIDYLFNLIINLSNNETSNEILLLDCIKQNLVFISVLWFFGATGIGIVIVYLLIAFKGYCISYTIAAIIATFGIGKGLLFITSYMLLPNIILIPSMLYLSVKGISLSKNIFNNKFRGNIKLEILKYTILFIMIIIVIILISFIEVFVCKNLFKLCSKYIL